jgi:hypothetical protein
MQLEALTTSAKNGNGQDAFLAYRLANECAAIPQREQVARSLPAEAKEIATRALEEVAHAKSRCASVTARQIYDRTQNLRIAMQAGIRDASIAYYVDGPNGDASELTSRPDDVAVKQ